MKEQLKVIKHNPKDPYNIQHLFANQKKKGFLGKIKDMFSFSTKQSTVFTSDVRFWLKWDILYVVALFLSANIAFIPSLFWHAIQIAGSVAGFFVAGKVIQRYQSNKAYRISGRTFDGEMVALTTIATIFFLLPFVSYFR